MRPISQYFPEKLVPVQSHENVLMDSSLQVPPCKQGFESHGVDATICE